MNLRAKYVLDHTWTPRDNCAVTVEGGIIAAVGPAAGHADAVRDLGDCLLMPGTVNAHTHLELGFASGLVPPGDDFVDWLRRLTAMLRSCNAGSDRTERSVREGLRDTLRAGVTLLGDIAREPYVVREALRSAAQRPAVVSFGEVIAFGEILPRADEHVLAALDLGAEAEDLRIGISPHAPYTVEQAVLEACARHARAMDRRLCIHAAEFPDEARFMMHGDGPLRDFFVELGLWRDEMQAAACTSIEYLERSGVLHEAAVLAHANYVTVAEIGALAAAGCNVAYCPRTHAAFGHPPHPFVNMLDAGVNVCLGTDSLASNPDLSILAEMRFLRSQGAAVDDVTLLKMGTRNGARALGFAECTGELRSGMRADLIAVPLDPHGPSDPCENVLSHALPPAAVFVAGGDV